MRLGYIDIEREDRSSWIFSRSRRGRRSDRVRRYRYRNENQNKINNKFYNKYIDTVCKTLIDSYLLIQSKN